MTRRIVTALLLVALLAIAGDLTAKAFAQPAPSEPFTLTGVEGEPCFLDSGSTERIAVFQVEGGSKRTGYRCGYVFSAGTYRINVTSGGSTVTYTLKGSPRVPTAVLNVTRGMTQADVEGLIAPGVDLAWAPDAETVLRRPLPVTKAGVRFVNPRLQLAPQADNARVGVHVRAPGFIADNAVIRGNPLHTSSGRDKGSFGSVAFLMLDGGSAVVRNARASRIDTFARAEGDAHLGLVVEKPVLSEHLAYALYANGGTAGVSWWGGTVQGVGHEPWFRVIDDPRRGEVVGNVYVGHVTTTMPAVNIGKDSFTPRSGARIAGDTLVSNNAQFRIGQDATGVADGGSDPTDVLIYGSTLKGRGNVYIEHKVGKGQAKRIHVIGNVVDNGPPGTPGRWAPPVAVHRTTDSTVTGNVHVGGASTWVPVGINFGLTARGNGNGTPDLTLPTVPVVDPFLAQRQRIIAIDGLLSGVAQRQAAIDAERNALTEERAALVEAIGGN